MGSFKHAGDHHLEVDKIDKQLFHIFKVCCFKYKSSLTEVSGLHLTDMVTNFQAVTGESQRHWLSNLYGLSLSLDVPILCLEKLIPV